MSPTDSIKEVVSELNSEHKILVCFSHDTSHRPFVFNLSQPSSRSASKIFKITGGAFSSGDNVINQINQRLSLSKPKWEGNFKECMVEASEDSYAYLHHRGSSGCYLFIPKDLHTEGAKTLADLRRRVRESTEQQP